LDKLEWPVLLDILAGYSQTEDGRARALALTPKLDREAIAERWSLVDPLKALAVTGYKAPIGALAPLGAVFRAAALGQMLDGPALRAVAELLESTRKVNAFAAGLEARCSTLRKVKARILPMPQLAAAINRAVGPEGELLDDASEELTRIRRLKQSLRRRIEESLAKLIHDDKELTPYLQDDFFTVRSDRYVVPMKLDGRGRVKGSILDTSTSGQTLFIEPAAIAPMNQQLLELDVEEKLEIARIFRDLSAKVEADVETLKGTYAELVDLDALTAEAQLAAEIHGGTVELTDAPVVDLIDARHPLIRRSGGRSAVGNHIQLAEGQHVLIISGPNAGGKTVVLKTVGLLQLMAKAGLLLPAEPTSRLGLFQQVYLEMGDAQNLAANLSTFSGHLLGLKPILERAGAKDLVLLDELAVGTDPQTGAAIGTAVLEDLAARRVTALVTTHFDALKGLAVSDRRFRNGSMEFSLGTLTPTYRLILDLPGQSYGLEVAEQIGLPAAVLSRARELRHGTMSNLDQAVNELMAARDEARGAGAAATREKLAAEAERVRWQQEVDLLKEQRRKTAQQLADKYEGKVQELREQFDDLVRKLRQAAKDGVQGDGARDAVLADRRAAEKVVRDLEGVVSELGQGYDVGDKLPGQPVAREMLTPNAPVFVLPLKKAGKVLRIGVGSDETVEVEVGVIKLRVSAHDLRLLSPGEAAGASGRKGPSTPTGGSGKGKPPRDQRDHQRPGASGTAVAGGAQTNQEIGLTLQTPTNTVDLRGKDADQAIEAAWNFLDRALMRGEGSAILIHGHGEGTLKARIREALRTSCPYDIRFRPGMDQEGGDGVTIVQLKT
jgi:DNA mismatch repair protein MutS2